MMIPAALPALFCHASFTCPEETALAVRFDGAAGAAPKDTLALPMSPPPLTWTVSVPLPEAGAVYRPLPLTWPAPATDHAQAGCVLMALPNWSTALAVNG